MRSSLPRLRFRFSWQEAQARPREARCGLRGPQVRGLGGGELDFGVGDLDLGSRDFDCGGEESDLGGKEFDSGVFSSVPLSPSSPWCGTSSLDASLGINPVSYLGHRRDGLRAGTLAGHGASHRPPTGRSSIELEQARHALLPPPLVLLPDVPPASPPACTTSRPCRRWTRRGTGGTPEPRPACYGACVG
uniref:Uncharacterized protein n=1 Tax=Arundo donax TaxID=35708 RepID=A0A0A9IPL2_ARUDO